MHTRDLLGAHKRKNTPVAAVLVLEFFLGKVFKLMRAYVTAQDYLCLLGRKSIVRFEEKWWAWPLRA